MARFVLIILLVAYYSFTTGDLLHLIDNLADKDNFLVMVSVCFSLVGIELLSFFPSIAGGLTVKFRHRVQLAVHILLGINSVIWMFFENKTQSKIIFFVVVFVFNLIIIHKIIHSINEDK